LNLDCPRYPKCKMGTSHSTTPNLIEDLPSDLLLILLKFLPCTELISCSLVSHPWHETASSFFQSKCLHISSKLRSNQALLFRDFIFPDKQTRSKGSIGIRNLCLPHMVSFFDSINQAHDLFLEVVTRFYAQMAAQDTTIKPIWQAFASLGDDFIKDLTDRLTLIPDFLVSCEIDPSRSDRDPSLDATVHYGNLIPKILQELETMVILLHPTLRLIFQGLSKLFRPGPHYHSVVSYFFHWFLCPGLLPRNINRHHKRKRIVVLQILQNIVNQSPFGNKEEFMKQFNGLCDSQRPVFRRIIQSLCEPVEIKLPERRFGKAWKPLLQMMTYFPTPLWDDENE